MSKFLKFIVHFVVICTIVCAAGLILPPFFGVTTEIMTDSKENTNLPIGSVTYAIPVKATDIYVGDPILVHEDSKIYRYSVQALDLENGTGTVVDPSVTNGETITVAVKEYVPKVVFTLNGVGYLYVATQSTEGKIILGLAVLFLIILYIIAELWEKDPKEEEKDVNSSKAYVKSKKELKREEKERARMMKEEEREIRSENKEKKKKKKAEKRIIRTGGFVDEIEEDDDEYTEEPARPVSMQSAASEAHEVLKKEIAAATSEEPDPTAELKEMLGEIVGEESVKREERQTERMEEEKRDIAVPVGKMVIPQWSVSALANRAKSAGDSPEIIKDDITDVTLFDYSDIVGEEEEE